MMRTLPRLVWIVSSLMVGCAVPRPALDPSMAPLELSAKARANKPHVLQNNHFKRDLSGSISEEDLKTVLAAPVFLEDAARVGVVPVATCYKPDPNLPLTAVPEVLSQAMEATGLFTVTTEVATDWPVDSGISGLRELAGRYRSEYLLLYRHRFIDRSYTNAWGWSYLTVIGTLFAPSQTLEAAGVLEATLFEVKTGTLLFTVYERVKGHAKDNLWRNDQTMRELKAGLIHKAAKQLADEVVDKIRRLAKARPRAVASSSAINVGESVLAR